MSSTKEKVKIMKAYLNGKDILWTRVGNELGLDAGGVHNIRQETDSCSPIWNWGQVRYEIATEKFDRIVWINTQASTTGEEKLAGIYNTKEEARANGGGWNNRIAVKISIKEID